MAHIGFQPFFRLLPVGALNPFATHKRFQDTHPASSRSSVRCPQALSYTMHCPQAFSSNMSRPSAARRRSEPHLNKNNNNKTKQGPHDGCIYTKFEPHLNSNKTKQGPHNGCT